MFEVGRLVARIALEGAAAFGRDVKKAGDALEAVGPSGQKGAKGATAVGVALDATATKATKTTKAVGTTTASVDGLGRASSSTSKKVKETGDQTERVGTKARQSGRDLEVFGQKGLAASTEVGHGMAIAGAGIVAFAGLAVSKFASFDKAISGVSATTGENAENMALLRQAALDAGGATKYSAEQAANAEVQLAKAGVSTASILGGGLAGSLSLAAAGEIEVADAAETAATAMTQFKLSGEDIPHLADLLAAGAGKAQGGVGDLSAALKQSGLVAAQMGINVEDTIGTLSAFASAGLLGSDAGTSFKTMLLSLASPSATAQKYLDKYNISAYDAKGNFVGLANLADQLKTNLSGATQAQRDQALSTIFGTDAIRAANVLYSQGASGINDWTDKVNDSGYAAKQAAELQNNLVGDVEKLGGAFDTALIGSASGANDVLRDLVQNLTAVVDGFSKLDPGVQSAVFVLGLALGAVLLFGGGLLVAIPKIVAFRGAMATLATQSPLLVGRLGKLTSFLTGPWGLALAAAALGVELLGNYLESLKASSDEMQSSLIGASSAADIFATASKGQAGTSWGTTANELSDLNNVLDVAARQATNWWERIGNSSNFNAEGALRDIGDELGTLAGTDLPAAQKAFGLLAAETDGSRKHLVDLVNFMPGFRDELINQGLATGVYKETMSEAEKETALLALAQGNLTPETKTAASAALEAADAFTAEGDGAAEAQKAIDGLISSIRAANDIQISAQEAAISYEESLAKVAEQSDKIAKGEKGVAKGIKLTTEEGRANREMLLDLAKAGQDKAQADLDAGGSAEEYRAALVRNREEFVKSAESLGVTAGQAEKLADKIYQIPSQKAIDIVANVQAATDNIDRWITLQGNKRVKIHVDAVGGKTYTIAGTGAKYEANGGVLSFYGNGGLRDSPHVAQIAAAGTMRVFAEPETGGEGYIPLAPAKRGRSTEILGTIADMFGYQLAPKVKSYSEGGVEIGKAIAASGGRPVELHVHNPITKDLVTDTREASQVLGSMMRLG